MIFAGIIFTLIGFTPGFCDDTMVRAKIGIQIGSDEKLLFAKSRDRLRSGDMLRIFVLPEKAAFIYVIYSDKKDVALLKKAEPSSQKSTLVLPSINEYFEIDGNSETELFTIVCSPVEIYEIADFLSSEKSYEKWVALENDLIEKSKLDLTQKSDTPFSIAGNVRRATKSDQSYLTKLQIFSGNLLVIKKYEFKIKK